MFNNLSAEEYAKKSKEIFKLVNEYRRDPQILIKYLQNLKRFVDPETKVLSEPNKMKIQMVDGEEVFIEAIEYLKRLKPLGQLKLDENLCNSAMAHVMDIGTKGLLTYHSSDGTEPDIRIAQYGNFVGQIGENLDFGPNNAQSVVVALVLDDGEPNRPHRVNLFNHEFKNIGIACGPHKTEYHMCVMDFASNIFPLGNENIEDDTIPIKKPINNNDDFPIRKSFMNHQLDFGNQTGSISNIIKEVDIENTSIVSKTVEITEKVIYFFEDGTSKEVINKKSQVFKNRNTR